MLLNDLLVFAAITYSLHCTGKYEKDASDPPLETAVEEGWT